MDGFRNHAGFENKSTFVKFNLQKSKAAHAISILHFDSPYAFDPGGLTNDEVSVSRSQARKKNETYAAGESVRQSQMAWKYKPHFEVENWNQPFTIAQGSLMENCHLKTVACQLKS